MMATIDADRLMRDLTYVETKIANHPELQVMLHRVFTDGQQVKVEVEGGAREARAWRAAFDGRITPGHIDRFHVWRRLVIASQVEIQVLEHPKLDEVGGINTAIAIILAVVGLFLWGFAHGSRTPNGAWIAAVAVVGAVVLLLATGITSYRRREHRDAEQTKELEGRLKQDTSGAHYLDGA